jgi:hypothetical protein
MATDGVSLYYNPEFVDTLNSATLAGVLAHEVMHPALQHHVRRSRRDPKRWNEACDYAINPLLLDAGRVMSLLTPDRIPVGFALDRKRVTPHLDSEKQRFRRFHAIPASKKTLWLLALKFAPTMLAKTPIVLEAEGLGRKEFHGSVTLLVNRHTASAAKRPPGSSSRPLQSRWAMDSGWRYRSGRTTHGTDQFLKERLSVRTNWLNSIGAPHELTKTTNFNTLSNLSAISKESEPVEYLVNAFAALNFRVACLIPRTR